MIKQCDIFLIFMLVLMSTHNLGFKQKLKKVMCTPVNLSFSIYGGGLNHIDMLA